MTQNARGGTRGGYKLPGATDVAGKNTRRDDNFYLPLCRIHSPGGSGRHGGHRVAGSDIRLPRRGATPSHGYAGKGSRVVDKRTDDIRAMAERSASELSDISARMERLRLAIRQVQPPRNRSLLLYLYHHRKTCLGCPHPVWKQWSYHAENPLHKWQSHAVKTPLRRLPRDHVRRDLEPLVREVLALGKRKQSLVKRLSDLRKCLAQHGKNPIPKTKPAQENTEITTGPCGL